MPKSKVDTARESIDIRLAGDVQNLLLPKSSPQCDWCCMAARNRMVNVLGGDYYDFIKLHDGCLGVLIGDVTGHGVHATIVMALVYGFVHRTIQDGYAPKELVAELNTFLRTFARRSQQLDYLFSTTMFFGVIDPGSLKMRYVNAGHPAGLVRRGNKLFRLPATSHPVGFFDQDEFLEETFQLTDKDRFLLYTDGLVDVNNPSGEMFGNARLEDAFSRLDGDLVVFIDALLTTVDDYLAGQSPFDDCTALVIDFDQDSAGRERA